MLLKKSASVPFHLKQLVVTNMDSRRHRNEATWSEARLAKRRPTQVPRVFVLTSFSLRSFDWYCLPSLDIVCSKIE